MLDCYCSFALNNICFDGTTKVEMPMLRLGLLARFAIFPCCILICSALGCGDASSLKVYPTTGTVNYKGKPLENAVVNFMIPGKEGQPSTVIGQGTSDSQGKFKITTIVDPTSQPLNGAVEGKHQVTVSKYIPPKGMTEEDLAKMQARETQIMQEKGIVPPEDITPSRIPFLPPKYQHPTMSELTAEVKPGEKNDFTFDLN